MRRPEEQIHRAVVTLLHIHEVQGRLVFFTVPNQRGTRSRMEMNILKGLGVRAGVPDIVVLWGEGRCGFLEMKSEKGRMSPAQLAFQEDVTARGFPYAICRSLDDVTDALLGWGVIRASRDMTKRRAAA